MIKHLFISSIVLSLSLCLWANIVIADTTTDAGRKAAQYLISQRQSNGAIDSFSVSGWALQGLNANGLSSASTTQYVSTIDLASASATDLERTILAVLAGGKDPHNIEGQDLVSALRLQANNRQIGSTSLVNDDTFGVLALLASGESINDPIVKDSIDFIAAQQQPDGSFSWSTQGVGDSNDTSIAIQALQLGRAKGYTSTANLDNALKYLHTLQNDDGGFSYQSSYSSDSSSTSWVTNALISLGETPENWVRNNNNPYSYLVSLQQNNGAIKADASQPVSNLATAYAAIALAHKALPVAVLASPAPSPSLSPMPSPTPSPEPSPTIVTSPSAAPSPEMSPSPTPTPFETDITDQSSPDPSPSLQPSPQPSPIPTPVVASPSPSPAPSPIPVTSPIVTPTPEPVPVLAPSPSPAPSLSPIEPTPAASPLTTQRVVSSAIKVALPSPAPSVSPAAHIVASSQIAPTTKTPAPSPQTTEASASTFNPQLTTDITDNQPVLVSNATDNWRSYGLAAILVITGTILSIFGIVRVIIGQKRS